MMQSSLHFHHKKLNKRGVKGKQPSPLKKFKWSNKTLKKTLDEELIESSSQKTYEQDSSKKTYKHAVNYDVEFLSLSTQETQRKRIKGKQPLPQKI